MRVISLITCLGLIFAAPAHADNADEWIAEVCDGISMGDYGAGDAVAALGEPEDCYGHGEDDPEFGPHGEITAIWPGVTLIHRGIIPYPSAANRIEFTEPVTYANDWVAKVKQDIQQMDWATDLDPSDQMDEYVDPDGANRIFRVEYDQDGNIIAFSFSSLH